jgi:hypothetical protein
VIDVEADNEPVRDTACGSETGADAGVATASRPEGDVAADDGVDEAAGDVGGRWAKPTEDGSTADEAKAERRPVGETRWRRLPLILTLIAGVVLVAGTIGPPLIGGGTFLASDVIYDTYPWRATADPVAEGVAAHGPVGDTIDSTFPARAGFADALRDGEFLSWSPFSVGGTVLGADGSSGTISPFELAYVALPAWFAPAVIKLGVMAAAIGFTYLFCRRLGAGRVPALFGGMAFAGSGFMVMWTNWPQPEVAAFIPAVFWATERFLVRPSVRAACPIAVAVAVMLLGNFPAVVLHTVYVLVPYVGVRAAVMHKRTLRRGLALVAGAGSGVVTGGLLTAAVLLPFALRLQYLGTESRSQNPDLHLGLDSLFTAVAPKALGLSSEGVDSLFFGAYNQVEAVSFVGVTTALLALAGVALPRLRATPGGARAVLVAATLLLGWATYVGGSVLGMLQTLPGFDESFVGRTRAILGFMVAVLAALGLQAIVERRWPSRRPEWIWAAVVVGLAGLAAAYAGNRTLWRARDVGQVDILRTGVVLPALVGLGAVAAVVVVRWGGRRAATAAVAALPVLLAVESLNLALPLLPNEDRSSVYPTTDGIDFLAATTGHDRIAFEGISLYGNGTALFGLRGVTGHSFYTPTWKEAVTRLDPSAFRSSGTFAFLAGSHDVVASPLLDRMGARWFAANPGSVAPGVRESARAIEASCADTAEWRDDVTVSVPAGDGLRGLVLRVCEPAGLPADAAATVEVPGGTVPTRVPLVEAIEPGELAITVPAGSVEDAASGTIDVRLSLDGAGGQSLALATSRDGEVVADAVRPTDDGLRLAYADDLVVYERGQALPRVHWAGHARTVIAGAERLDLLASGGVADDTVLLSEDGPAGSGARAEVSIDRDTPTSLGATVDADGDGYVVVADALQHGWVAEVDGERADLVDADHVGVAVHVPEGRHEVTLRYAAPGQRAGLAVSAVAVLGLVAAWVWGDRVLARWADRERRSRPRSV